MFWDMNSFFFLLIWGGVRWVHLVCQPVFVILYQPQMIGDDRCGAVSGMQLGRGDQSTWRKLTPVQLYPPQIPHDLTWARTLAAAVGSRWPTAWAVAWTLRYGCTFGALIWIFYWFPWKCCNNHYIPHWSRFGYINSNIIFKCKYLNKIGNSHNRYWSTLFILNL
jgi:hypothetical protein